MAQIESLICIVYVAVHRLLIHLMCSIKLRAFPRPFPLCPREAELRVSLDYSRLQLGIHFCDPQKRGNNEGGNLSHRLWHTDWKFCCRRPKWEQRSHSAI